MPDQDFFQKERTAGNKAASSLRGSFRSKIKQLFQSRSGAMEKSNVTARYRDGFLDRLIIATPKYSFTKHFGSSLSGTTKQTERSASSVNSFVRHINGTTIQISAHERKATHVVAHVKGINYKSTNHISEALRETNALEQLATDLGENRIVDIASQIDFT